MGGRLCTRIVESGLVGNLDHLTNRERAALMFLAAVARDEPKGDVEAGIYYGGWPMLARFLGYPTYTPTAKRSAARTMGRLVDLGLAKPLSAPSPGHRQGYKITIPEAF